MSIDTLPITDEILPDDLAPAEPQAELDDEEKVIPQELADALRTIVKEVETEEGSNRSTRLRELRKFDKYWEGVQKLYYSDVARDWKSATELPDTELDGTEEDIVNIYRAYGESIIAALSTGVPVVRFFPDDADIPEDILAARAHSKLAELVQKHNKAPLLFIKALFTLWNQHFVAAYHYPKEDASFGIHRETTTELQETTQPISVCSTCGAETEQIPCPYCGGQELGQDEKQVQEPVEKTTETPKSRMMIEIYGSLNVLIPENTTKQADAGFLIFYTEEDVALLRSIYRDKQDEIQAGIDSNEAWSRENARAYLTNTKVTVKQVWFRPWLYFRLGKGKEELVAQLEANYPDGVYLVIVGDEILEASNEKLDDRWTLSESPISRTLHSRPIGAPVIPLQDTKNDLFSLSKETVAHGIPETFYDSQIIDADLYKATEIKPGTLFPVKRKAGQNISDSFFQLRSATFSKEISTFEASIQQDAQFVVGAFPSIYGGPNEGNSNTLGEYAMSRNQALQRLQNYWKMLNAWWATIMSKVVPEYVTEMKEDEKFVKAQGKSFVNVWIRKDDLEGGKIGQVEPDTSEQFPLSWAQKKDLLIQILTLNNPVLNETIFHPENANVVAQAMGFPEVYVPGDEDRTKQLFEINRMLLGEQVPIEPEVDNHPVHIEVTRAWMNSDVGQEAKFTNQAGYLNCLQHLRMHLQLIAGTPMPSEKPNPQGEEKEKGKNPEATAEPGNIEPPIASPIQ